MDPKRRFGFRLPGVFRAYVANEGPIGSPMSETILVS